jgi:uncharacterized protein YjbI with pentapeptide repeats
MLMPIPMPFPIDFIIWLLISVQTPRFWDITRDTAGLLAQPIATTTAGTIVGVGAWLGFKASRESRLSAEKLAREKNFLDEEKAWRDHQREVMSAQQERFTAVAGQLASEHEPVRLGGVYGLTALADEWQEAGHDHLRDAALELLCAYMRSSNLQNAGDPVRAAIISLIRSRTHKEGQVTWPAGKLDLHSANLIGANFQDCDLSGVNLHGACLKSADLRGSKLIKTRLSKTEFTNALLNRADLTGSKFFGCDFRGAKLNRTILRGTTYGRVVDTTGEETVTYECNFKGAQLIGAEAHGAKMRSAIFGTRDDGPATILAAPLNDSEVIGFGRKYTYVTYDDETRWPINFDLEYSFKTAYSRRRRPWDTVPSP